MIGNGVGAIWNDTSVRPDDDGSARVYGHFSTYISRSNEPRIQLSPFDNDTELVCIEILSVFLDHSRR